MTDQTRETLEQMYAYAASRAEWHPSLMPVTDPAWDLDDLAECVEQAAHWGLRALALRDVLTPRTCGTCRHFIDQCCMNKEAPAYDMFVAPDDGCLLGWQAREGEGGTR